MSDTESHHAIKVLRLSPGDEIEAIDGSGNLVRAQLRKQGKEIYLDFVALLQSEIGGVLPIRLETAILKRDAMNLVVEKAVELGVASLQPLMTEFTVIKTERKGASEYQAKWQKIADLALKQCKRTHRMEILPPKHLAELESGFRFCADLDQPEFFSVLQSNRASMTSAAHPLSIMIGPEGGWSEKDRETISSLPGTVHRVGLGSFVLRAETAAIAALGIMSAYFRSLTKN